MTSRERVASLPRAALLATLILVAACASPLRVRRVAPADFYREQTGSALSSSDVSELTRTVLRRHDLLDDYKDEPDQAIAALRESLVRGTAGRDDIFALAELSLFRAQRRASAPHYLAAAL